MPKTSVHTRELGCPFYLTRKADGSLAWVSAENPQGAVCALFESEEDARRQMTAAGLISRNSSALVFHTPRDRS